MKHFKICHFASNVWLIYCVRISQNHTHTKKTTSKSNRQINSTIISISQFQVCNSFSETRLLFEWVYHAFMHLIQPLLSQRVPRTSQSKWLQVIPPLLSTWGAARFTFSPKLANLPSRYSIEKHTWLWPF